MTTVDYQIYARLNIIDIQINISLTGLCEVPAGQLRH